MKQTLKQGFKVKETKVYVAKASPGGWHTGPRPAPRAEVVEAVQKVWNDQSLKPLRKFVDSISIQYSKTLSLAGKWHSDVNKVTIYDDGKCPASFYESVMIHEVKGHAFFYWALKYRREELVNFCRLANKLPAITTYVRDNEARWREINDEGYSRFHALDRRFGLDENVSAEEGLSSSQYEEYCTQLNALTQEQETDGHVEITRYANEIHSAIAELLYGMGHDLVVPRESLNEIIEAYNTLHGVA